MAVSAKDIARRAGVSQQTVSSVINNNPHARISAATQDLVRRTASEMGYRPNHLARSLVKQRTETIGLMISDLENPFFVNVLRHAEDLIFKAGYRVLLDANSRGYAEYQDLSRISAWQVDGVLMWTSHWHHLSQFLGARSMEVPVVYLGHLPDDESEAVVMDLYGAGKRAAEHLLERGYRRLCFVSPYSPNDFLLPDHQSPRFRNNQMPAFQDVCRQAGMAPEYVVLENTEDIEAAGFQAGLAIAARPPSERPDALVCHNDWMAHFVVLGLLHGGLRTPDDVAVVGFDGISPCRYLPTGPLTTMRLPVDVLCKTALDILLNRIGGDRETPPQQVLIPMELVVGGTT